MSTIHSHIFREYDIRGEVPGELNEAAAREIARAFGLDVIRRLGVAKPRICLGWDGRLSSPMLKNAIASGLMDAGADVLEIGLGPTPLTYYSVFTLDADGCVMLTGSHNPPNYNGLKLMVGKRPFFGEMIQGLFANIQAGLDLPASKGSLTQHDLLADYLTVLTEAAGESQKPLKVVWDCGNGASGEVVQALVQQLAGEHEVLFGEIDGNFPNHHPDPSVPENMQDLKDRVLASGADIGIAFDGDGDRIGVVDNKGRIWAGDQILAICAEAVLKKQPGAEIIVDVKTSQGVTDHIVAHGGKPIIYKTGHSNIKSKLIETGAPLAGEMSGHMFFADSYYGIDDAIYAAMRMLNILGNSERSASDLLDALPVWHSTPEIRVECADDKKFTLIEELASALQSEGKEFSSIDGVRVQCDAGWWLLRASNTQPVLVARIEAKEAADLDVLKRQVAERLSAYGVRL